MFPTNVDMHALPRLLVVLLATTLGLQAANVLLMGLPPLPLIFLLALLGAAWLAFIKLRKPWRWVVVAAFVLIGTAALIFSASSPTTSLHGVSGLVIGVLWLITAGYIVFSSRVKSLYARGADAAPSSASEA